MMTEGGCCREEGGSVLPRFVWAVEDQFSVKESRGEKVLSTSGMISALWRLWRGQW